MSFFSEIEKSVERGFRRWTEKMFGKAELDDLLLVHRAILQDVESRIETEQRGRSLFPYDLVRVRLTAPDDHRRAVYVAAFAQDSRLQSEIRNFLAVAGCEVPRAFRVELEIENGSEYHLEVTYEMQAAMQQPPTLVARLVVVAGKTAEESYALSRARTNIGRLTVLMDRNNRPLRRNDIVFEEDGGEVNATVSRSHAHVRSDRAKGEYRICDDGSEYGTRVFRDGRAIDVPAGTRGERLQPGDEIYFGRACVRFEAGS